MTRNLRASPHWATVGALLILATLLALSAPARAAETGTTETDPSGLGTAADTDADTAGTGEDADDDGVTLPSAPSAPRPAVTPSERRGNRDARGDGEADAALSLDLPGAEGTSQSVLIILLLTLLSVAPALLMMLTSFTRIVIVLSLTRNALGLQAVPPNQVIVGLALFLSLFVMSPTLSRMNADALQPMLRGQMTQGQAYDAAVVPLREFMLGQTRQSELGMFVNASEGAPPARPADVSLTALVPAFIISELKTAFIIGFVVFIPFLVIDIVVSSTLMSMGMMMLPPALVSLPFKLLLFVMVDGWALLVRSLLSSFA